MPGKRYREPLGDDVLEQMLQEAGEEGLGEPQEPERGVPGAPGFNLGRLLEQGGRGFLEGAQLPVKAEPQTPAEGVAAGLTKVAGRVTTPIGQAKSLPVAGASLLKAGQYLGDFVKGLAAPLLTGFEWHYEPDTGDFVKHDTEVVENLPPEARRAIERDGFYVDQKKKEIIQPFQVNGRIEYRIMRELERKASPLGSAELTNTWLKSTGDPELTALAEAKTPSIPVPQVPVVKQLAELGNMMIGGGEDPIKYAASLYGFGKAMGPFHKAIGPGAGMVEKGLGAAARKLAPGLEKPLTAAARTLGQEVAPFMAGAGTIAAVEAPGGDQEALEAFKQGAVGALPMWAGFKALGLFTGPMAKAFTRTREVGEKIEQKQARGEEVKPAELDEFRKVIEGDLYELGEADIRSLAESARKHPRGGDLLASQILKRWEDSRAAHIKDISGLPNRRAFQKQYHAMLAEGWTPVRMDGDRTKAYNDTYGHTFTDKILGEQGRAIERTAKAQGGRAYHVSGDEYEVMYPPGVDAYKSAAEVREAVGTLRIKAPDGTEIRPSVTAGVGRPGEFEELADQAANYAKYRRSGLETYDSYDQLTPEQKVAVRKAREGRPTDIPTLELRNRHQAEILREAKIPEARWADMLTETEMDVSGELYQLAAKYYKGEIKLAEAAKAARNLYDRLPTTADKASVDQVENKVLEAIKAGQTHADMIAATTDLGIADINRALSKLQLKDVIKRDPRTNTWQHTGKEVEVRATGEEPPPGKKALADLEPDELRAEVDQMVVRAGGGEDRRYRLAALSPEEAGRARALEYLAALKRRGATAEQLAPLVEAIEAGKATFKNHEQLVRQAVEARQPVSAFAVNKYRIPLPSEYDLVRNTWVWKGEPPETPESEPSPEPVPEPGPGIIEGEYDFRRQAEEAGWGKEEVEAVMGLVRARAKVKGQAPDEWLAGKKLRIERGGEPGPGALAQIGPVYHGGPHTFDDRAVTINKRTLYQRGQPEAREVEMEYVAEDGRRYTEKLTQVPIETAITRHRREAPDLLGWQAQEARERLPKFKLAYTSAGELRVMSGPKVDNRVPDFLAGNTERKAQMIVESRTMEEVEGYLDDIFGTHQELDALAESGKTSRKLELADLFRADLEHAARERDIEAVKAGLDELKYLFATDPKNHYELYQKAGARIKGSVELADGSTIIRAFEGADVSTLVHELGHVFRLDLAPEELAAAEKAFGVRKGSWDTAAEERFARGFEEYLRTGKAPQPELEGVMAKLKAWLAEIYQSVRNTLTDKQRDFYDRMLGKPEGEKPATTRVAYAVDDNSREALTFILSEIESGWTAPGGLVRNEDGEVVGKYGNMSGFSDFAKKLVGRNTSQLSVSMSADELARAITRALEGETVTERQSRALDDAMDIYREHQGGGDTGWLTEAMKDWAQLSDLPKPRARYAKHIKEWSQEEMPDLGQRQMPPRPAAFTEGGEIEARTVGGPYGEAEGRGLPLFDERSQMTQDELDRKLGQVFMDLGIEQPMSRVKGQGSSETGGLPEGAEGIRPRGQGAKGELPGVNTNQKLNAKDWQIELPAEPVTKERVTKLDVLQQVARDWGVPVRNMATHRFKNPGMYYPHKVLIRLKNWGELEPLAHELAHHIDRVLAKRWAEKNPNAAPGRGWRSDHAKELGPLDYDQEKKRPAEGWAEFMRYYLTGETGPEKAPDFHKFFTGSVLRDNPDLAGKLGRLRSMIKTWYDQGAEARVMAQIGPRLPKTAGERTRTAWEWFNRKFRDANRPFEKLVDELKGYNVSLKPSQDPFQLATFFNKKAKASAWHWLFTAQVDPLTGKKIGEPLSHALRDIAPRDFDKFMAYWVAKREKVRYQRNGLESGFDLTDIDHVLKKHQRPEWDRAIDEATEWDRNLLRQYLVRPGLLNQSQLQAIMELNPIYLPFKRMPQGQESPLIPGGGKYANAGKGIHRVKGGSEPIEHPIKQLMAQTQDLVARGQRAYVTKALVDLTEKHGVGGIINEVPAQLVITKKPYGDTKLEPFKRTEQGAEPIPEAARATDEYLTPDILKGLLKENGFAVEDADIDAMLTVFTQSPVYRGKDNIVSMWKDGRQHFYEVNPEIYRALLKLDIPRITGLLKIMAPFSRGLRLGATGLNATFSMLTNPVFRDPFTYAAQSRFPGSNPLEPIGTNLRRLAKTTELEGRAEHAGMGASAFLGTDRNLIYDEMLMRNRRTLGNRMLLVVKHPIETLKEIFSFGEMGPRMLELRKAYEDNAKKHPDWTEEDRFVDAFNAAQDVTVNFTRMGEWGEKVNQAAAFFNVAIQGPDKMIRSARRNPAGFVLRGMAYLSTLGVANWAANRKKQWYKNLPLSYKYSNLFWEIPGAGTIVRCPLPFELGTVFVGLPVASLDAMEGGKADEKARAWLETLKAQMPDPMPTMVQPALDVARNKDWLGRPIESKSMEYLPVTKRTRYYTSDLARVLSEGFGKVGIEISPVQLDYMMAAYSGNIERAVPTRFFKRAAQGKPAEAADWPVVGRLILRDPESPRRQMEDFWLTMERLTQQERFNKASGLGPLPDNDRRRLDQAKEFKKRWDDYYSVELKRLNDEARKDQPGARAELKRVYAEMQRELERFGFD